MPDDGISRCGKGVLGSLYHICDNNMGLIGHIISTYFSIILSSKEMMNVFGILAETVFVLMKKMASFVNVQNYGQVNTALNLSIVCISSLFLYMKGVNLPLSGTFAHRQNNSLLLRF